MFPGHYPYPRGTGSYIPYPSHLILSFASAALMRVTTFWWWLGLSVESLLPKASWQHLTKGGVVIVPNFVSAELIASLRADSEAVHAAGLFSVDGLTNTAARVQQFSAADRQTSRQLQWDDPNFGDIEARRQFARLMASLREEAARELRRDLDPSLPHEMSYNRYEPGASLGRHLDEHHEESKGRDGWRMPSRRSVTWLVYQNTEYAGGKLRCYERLSVGGATVGASPSGDVQVGWLDDSRPVYLGDSRDKLRLYYLDGQKRPRTIGAELDRPFSPRRLPSEVCAISTPQNDDRAFNPGQDTFAAAILATSDHPDVRVVDVDPAAGTLVAFDSVAVPHEVLQVTSRTPRLAVTGWFHQSLPAPDTTFF